MLNNKNENNSFDVVMENKNQNKINILNTNWVTNYEHFCIKSTEQAKMYIRQSKAKAKHKNKVNEKTCPILYVVLFRILCLSFHSIFPSISKHFVVIIIYELIAVVVSFVQVAHNNLNISYFILILHHIHIWL